MKHLILLMLSLLLFSCSEEVQKTTLPMNIIFSCDIQGKLEPCGCFEGQFGGMSRFQSQINTLDPRFTLKVDAGDAISGTEDYDIILYKHTLQAFDLLKYQALNMGAKEAALSLSELKKIKSQPSGHRIISANLSNSASGHLVFPSHTILNQNGHKIMITGVVDPSLVNGSSGKGIQIKEIKSSLDKVLTSHKADFNILLAFCTPEKMKELAEHYYEFDLIIGGKTPQPSQDLIKVNRSIILYTTNQAKNLGWIQTEFNGQKIQNTDFDIPLLLDTLKEDPLMLQIAADYRKEIRSSKLGIDNPHHSNEKLIPGVSTQATYVGSKRCAACHNQAHQTWEKSAHSQAFESLQVRDADADPKCISCHVVGFGEESGYQRSFNGSKHVNVGCESCHGPGSEHVRQRSSGNKTLFQYRPLGEGDCRSCHHGEFSRPFNWQIMWPKIQHGKELQK